ncbi:chromosome partitioning protein ParB [Spirochaetia bacterium]|nr:chromosome partitioning protein ParB [Spirochaetia bacterium]
MSSKDRLGKGIEALFPMDNDDTSKAPPNSVPLQANFLHEGQSLKGRELSIPLDKLIANPNQPRKNFDEEALQELADSIREHGIIQPIIAEAAGDGTYIIVAGERRSRAARMAGLIEAPVLLRDYTDEKRMEVSLIENIQRADLNPVEEASAYRRLMDLTGFSQDEVAAKVGKNRSTVTNTLRLLKLPTAMLEALSSGALSPGHGRALLSVPDPAAQEALFREIADAGLSVREAEKRAATLNDGGSVGGQSSGEGQSLTEGDGAGKRGPAPRDPELAAMEQKFIDTLGTKVTISGDLARGSIRIDYYSMDDLDRLLGILNRTNG